VVNIVANAEKLSYSIPGSKGWPDIAVS